MTDETSFSDGEAGIIIFESLGGELLPPWPDELLVAEKLELAIAFLRGLSLPSRYASAHLQRWGLFVGVEITAREYRAVRRDAGLARRF